MSQVAANFRLIRIRMAHANARDHSALDLAIEPQAGRDFFTRGLAAGLMGSRGFDLADLILQRVHDGSF